jgi:hypothetical protein
MTATGCRSTAATRGCGSTRSLARTGRNAIRSSPRLPPRSTATRLLMLKSFGSIQMALHSSMHCMAGSMTGRYRGRWRLNVQIHLQAWPRGHCLKEARRAVQVRAIKGVAENQKSESPRRNANIRWDVLIRLRNFAPGASFRDARGFVRRLGLQSNSR